jgi:hypothetical protein
LIGWLYEVSIPLMTWTVVGVQAVAVALLWVTYRRGLRAGALTEGGADSST